MKKLISVLLITALLALLSSCSNSEVDVENPDPVSPSEQYIEEIKHEPVRWDGTNNNPIPFVKELSADDIDTIYYSVYRTPYIIVHETTVIYSDGSVSPPTEEFRYPLGTEYNALFIYDLSRLELTGKVEDFDENNTENYTRYNIEMKNGEIIVIHFDDNMIDFGEGYYYYTDVAPWSILENAENIEVRNLKPPSSFYYCCEDIEKLCDIFKSADINSPELKTYSIYDMYEMASFYFFNYDSLRSLSDDPVLCVMEEKGRYYLYKKFFLSLIYMGEINPKYVDSLILVYKGQFGTRESFYIKSGDSKTYLFSYHDYELPKTDSDFNNYFYEQLQKIYYEPNFEMCLSENSELRLIDLIDVGISEEINVEDIKTLAAGEYILSCFVVTKYVCGEEHEPYDLKNSYLFKLIKN